MAEDWLEDAAAKIRQPKQEQWMIDAQQEINKRKNARFRAALEVGLQKNPDQYAKANKTAKDLGVSTDLVERNLNELVGISKKKEILSRLQDTEYLKRAFESPEFASLAHDDADALAKLERDLVKAMPMLATGFAAERAARKFETSAKAAPAGLTQAAMGILQSVARTPEAVNRVLDAMNKITWDAGRAIGIPDWLLEAQEVPNPLKYIERGFDIGETHLPGASDSADYIRERMEALAQRPGEIGETFKRLGEKGRAADDALAKAFEGDVEPLAKVVSDPEAWAGFIGNAIPSLYLAYKTGGSLPFIAWLESMEVANDAAEFERLTGEKIDPVKFTQAAAQVAVVNAYLERTGLMKVFGGKSGKPLSSFFRGGFGESWTELSQEFNTNIAILLGFDPLRSPHQGVLGAAMGGFGTGGPGGVLSAMGMATGPNSEFAQNIINAQKALSGLEALDQAAENILNAKLKERSPEHIREFLDATLGAENDVYLDAKDAQTFFQDNPEVLEDLKKKAPETGEAIQESLDNNLNVAIPKADYLAFLTDHHEALRTKLRNDADSMTAEEAQQWLDKGEDQFLGRAEQILERQTEESEFAQSAERVAEKITADIVSTGRFTEKVAKRYGDLYKAFVVTAADRLGMMPEVFSQKFGLRVRGGPPTTEGMQYDQSGKIITETPEFKNWFGDSQVVDEKGKPLVVYHGSSAFRTNNREGIQEFKADMLGTRTGASSAEHGFFFSDSADVADTYNKADVFNSPLGGYARRVTIAQNYLEMLETQADAKAVYDSDEDGYLLHITEYDPQFGDENTYDFGYVYDSENAALDDWEIEKKRLIDEASKDLDNAEKEYNEHIKQETIRSGPVIYPVYLNITNPLVYDYDGGTYKDQSFTDLIEQAKEEGNDGVLLKNVVDSYDYSGEASNIYIAFQPTQIKSIFNRGTFDPNDPRILYQREHFQRGQRNLSALHSLSSENLLYADKLGGIALPSIALVPEDVAVEGYGDITLIGTREMGDPGKVPVYDADAYTTTFPRAEYNKVKSSEAQQLIDELRDVANEFDDYRSISLLWDYLVNDPKPQDAVFTALKSAGIQAFYLRQNGIDVKPIKGPSELDIGLVDTPSFQKFLNDTGEYQANFEYGGDYHKALSRAIKKAIPEYVDQVLADVADPEERSVLKQDLQKAYKSAYLSKEQLFAFGKEHALKRSIEKIGTNEVKLSETRETIEQAMKGHEEDFKSWVEDKILPLYGEPFLKLGSKKVEYTIDNIVKMMKKGGVQAKEKTLTFGEGMARASVAKRITSLQEARERAGQQIKGPKEIEKAREAAKKALSDWRDEVVKFTTHKNWRGEPDIWEALDSSMRAVAKWARRQTRQGSKEAMRSSLREEGFSGVSDSVIDQGIEAGKLMLEAPVPYFEAKPLRAVTLDEFAGAVVPNDVSDKVVNVLEKHNIPYKKYGARFDEKARFKAIQGLRSELAARGVETLFQREGSERGSIQFPDGGPSLISLLENADLSTFLHESGHFFFETYNRVASQADAPELIKADMDALLKFVGVDSLEAWNAMDAEQRRAGHEKVAEAFEKYLFEGKAPSTGLRSLFQTFRNWLVSVYKSMWIERVELTDEVRSVFDRMLATEQQIQDRVTQTAYEPLFTEMEGMTAQQWEQYRNLERERVERAQSEHTARSLRDMKWLANARSRELKRLQNEAKDKRKAIRAEVAEEVAKEPTYLAMKFLRTGEVLDERGREIQVVQGHRLDVAALEAMYPPGALVDQPSIAKLKRMRLTRRDGLHPNEVAQIFGFPSGDALVRTLVESEPINDRIERLTDIRMLQTYGDLTSPQAMEEAADEAVHNDAHVRFVHSEMTTLAKLTGAKNILARSAKAFAEDFIARKKVREIKPLQYLSAEARAARNAEQAFKKGDKQKAAEYKRDQVLNLHLYKAALAATHEVEKMRAYHAKFAKSSVRKKVGQEHMDRISAIQEAYSFRKSTSLRAIDAAKDFNQWVQAQIEAGRPIMIPDEVIQAAQRQARNYKDVPLEELRGATDAVKNLETLGRNERSVKVAEREMEIEDVVAGLSERMQKLPPVKRSNRQNPTEFEKAREEANYLLARLTKVSMITRWIDGDDPIGLAHDAIMQRANDAQAKYYALWEDVAKKILNKFRDMPREQAKRWRQEYEIPEVGRTMTVADMFMAALNTGTESNLNKLLNGYGWTRAQLNAVLARLTKEDWDLRQEVLDVIGSLKDELFDVAERVTGIRPKAVDPMPFDTPYGTYVGGYFPVKYDPRWSGQAARHEASAEDLIETGNQFLRRNVYAGMTQGRVEQYADAMKLDLSVIETHLREAIQFISHYEAVRDLDAITRNSRFEAQMKETFGEGHWREMRNWVRDLATRGQDTAPKDFMTHVLRHLRLGTTIAAMGFKASTGLVQILGLSTATKETGTRNMAKGLGRVFGHGFKGMIEARDIAFEHSQILKYRLKTFDREFNSVFRSLARKRGWHARLGEASLMHIGLIQLYTVDVQTWWAAYYKGVEQWSDHKRAVKYADWTVENTQGSGEIKDMAGVVRDRNEYLRALTMFYTYFSTFFAQERDIARTLKRGDYAKAAGGAFFLITLPIILEALMRGRTPECKDFDPECLEAWSSWLAVQHAVYPLQGIPIIRDMASGLEYGRDYEMSPVASTINKTLFVAQQAGKISKGEASIYATKTAVNMAGALLKLPVGQFTTTTQYLVELNAGKADADDPAEFIQELIYGEQKKK